MKRFFAATIAGILLLTASAAYAWEIDAQWQIGILAFDENLTITASGFDVMLVEAKIDRNDNLFYSRWSVEVGDYTFDELEGGIKFGIWMTETEGSTLKLTDKLFGPDLDGAFVLLDKVEATEDLNGDFYGYDFHAELGWGGEIGEESLHWAALMGYGYKKTKIQWLIPIDMQIIPAEEVSNNIDTYYDVHYIDFTGRLKVDITDDVAFLLEPSIGPVVASRRSDDYWGQIKGQGGLVLKVEGTAVWQVQDNIRVQAGAFYDLQYLEGGSRTIDAQLVQVNAVGNAIEQYDQLREGSATVNWDPVMEAFGATIGVDFLF